MLHLADHDPGAKIELYYRITEETAVRRQAFQWFQWIGESADPGPPESSHQRLGRGGLDS